MVSEIGKELLEALETRYRGEIASAKANVRVYLENPAGIGEHPDVVQAIDMELEKLASAHEKLELLLSRRYNFSQSKYPVE
tara:strand:+ start:211 stop:453 length:243 start_codon:yes stop_codon:yes gene_type:complete